MSICAQGEVRVLTVMLTPLLRAADGCERDARLTGEPHLRYGSCAYRIAGVVIYPPVRSLATVALDYSAIT